MNFYYHPIFGLQYSAGYGNIELDYSALGGVENFDIEKWRQLCANGTYSITLKVKDMSQITTNFNLN